MFFFYFFVCVVPQRTASQQPSNIFFAFAFAFVLASAFISNSSGKLFYIFHCI